MIVLLTPKLNLNSLPQNSLNLDLLFYKTKQEFFKNWTRSQTKSLSKKSIFLHCVIPWPDFTTEKSAQQLLPIIMNVPLNHAK